MVPDDVTQAQAQPQPQFLSVFTFFVLKAVGPPEPAKHTGRVADNALNF
jgi:hypothetical protein